MTLNHLQSSTHILCLKEMEIAVVHETMTRAGAVVTVASVSSDTVVTCGHGLKLMANCKISDCVGRGWDLIVCPGGIQGSIALAASVELDLLLKAQCDDCKLLGAICAAPALVLAPKGMLAELPATCYPSEEFTKSIPWHSHDSVVVSGNIVTSQGPATALAFSLKLVELLYGKKKSKKLAKEMLVEH